MRKLIRLKRSMRGDVVLLALAVTFLMALPVSGLGQGKAAPAGRGGTAGPSTTVGAVAPTSAQDDKGNGAAPTSAQDDKRNGAAPTSAQDDKGNGAAPTSAQDDKGNGAAPTSAQNHVERPEED
jgi:hypothetical protein